MTVSDNDVERICVPKSEFSLFDEYLSRACNVNVSYSEDQLGMAHEAIAKIKSEVRCAQNLVDKMLYPCRYEDD